MATDDMTDDSFSISPPPPAARRLAHSSRSARGLSTPRHGPHDVALHYFIIIIIIGKENTRIGDTTKAKRRKMSAMDPSMDLSITTTGLSITKDLSITSMEEELVHLRKQNLELKGLVQKGLTWKLAWTDLPSNLQEDREWLFAALEGESVSWYDLPQKWQDEAEMACIFLEKQRVKYKARKRNAFAVFSSDREVRKLSWHSLPYHLKMNKKILWLALQTERGPRWEDIPCQFQSDLRLLTTAVLYEKIRFEEVPADLQRNHLEIAFHGVRCERIRADECPCLTPDFLKQALEDGHLEWQLLPATLQNDFTFARGISFLPNAELAGQILEHVGQFRDDRSFWLKLVHEHDFGKDFKTYTIRRWLELYASQELLSDRHFMIEICRGCTDAFSLVDGDLISDRDFLEAVMGQNPAVLRFLSHETQQQHRDLVVNAIRSLVPLAKEDSMVAFYAAEAMYPPFWMEYEFAMNWVKGLGIPHNLPNEARVAWCNDRGLCLEAVKQGSFFHTYSPLTHDVSFMIEAMDHSPELYSCASEAVKSDFVVMTMAFADLPTTATEVMLKLHLEGSDDVIERYLDFLQSKLDPFNTFLACILGNMLSTQSVEETGTNLTLLNQGLETSDIYKKVLAEYLDIPTGKWLRRLQGAERSVLEAIAPWNPK